jgi:hypothetical protein
MRSENDTKLLREYVRHILAEEGGDGGGYGGYGAGDMVYGASFGDKDSLKNTFITPFTDVFKTAVGQSKELGAKAKTLVKVAFGTIVTTLIPGLGANYAQLFDEEKEKISKIRSEYSEVYKRTDDALGGGDAALLAFMAAPGLTLGAAIASKTPGVAKDLLSAFTGGLSDEAIETTKSKLQKVGRWAVGDSGESRSSGSRSRGRRSPSDFFGEMQLREKDDDKGSSKGKVYDLETLLKNKKFIGKVLNNPETLKIQETATEIYRETLKGVVAEAMKVLKNVNSVEELQKMTKVQVPEIQKLKSMDPEQRKVTEEKLIKGIRDSMKKFYVKNLKDQVKRVLDAGVPPAAQYVKDYQATIKKIESL